MKTSYCRLCGRAYVSVPDVPEPESEPVAVEAVALAQARALEIQALTLEEQAEALADQADALAEREAARAAEHAAAQAAEQAAHVAEQQARAERPAERQRDVEHERAHPAPTGLHPASVPAPDLRPASVLTVAAADLPSVPHQPHQPRHDAVPVNGGQASHLHLPLKPVAGGTADQRKADELFAQLDGRLAEVPHAALDGAVDVPQLAEPSDPRPSVPPTSPVEAEMPVSETLARSADEVFDGREDAAAPASEALVPRSVIVVATVAGFAGGLISSGLMDLLK